MLWRLLVLLAGAAFSQRIDRARDYPTTPVTCEDRTRRGCGRVAVVLTGGFSDVTHITALGKYDAAHAADIPPACGVCQEPFSDDADELPCCKARVCDACAKEVVAIVTCPFCGGDPSPPPPPPEEDCSNDAAIALALSERW